MKRKIFTLLALMTITFGAARAQETITVSASNEDISDHLDLEAVAYLFGESKDLETFEMKLNDPELLYSNLDLNNDGYVDYLRVVEIKEDDVFVITIQAVLGEELYQDVATIDVQVKDKKTVYVQVVGNEYLYGANYIFEPVYVHRPVIYDFFWYPRHVVWVSPWYWSYYPVHYRYRAPRHIHVYHAHVHQYYHLDCHYNPHRKIHKAAEIHHRVHRNDWAKKHDHQSFSERNKGVENRYELETRRASEPNTNRRSTINNNENAPSAVRKTRTDNVQNSRPAGREGNAPVVKSAPTTQRESMNDKPARRSVSEEPERVSNKSKVVIPGSSAPEKVYTKSERTVNQNTTRRPSDTGRTVSTRTESPRAEQKVRNERSQPEYKSKPAVSQRSMVEKPAAKPTVSPKSPERKAVSKPSAPAQKRSESKATSAPAQKSSVSRSASAPAKKSAVKPSTSSTSKRSSSEPAKSSAVKKSSDKNNSGNSRR
ncbi:MAG: hypothetical protein JXR22_10210 [Prolixibacteraceae bacterium]|nr:hypothetical protein [Prolixibacteraceae bacterium]